MQNKIKRALTASIAIAWLLCSCTERKTITPGKYVVFGYTTTKQALREGVKITQTPIFHFHTDNKSMTVSHDFNFGYFVDSVYKYKFKDNTLYLYGPNDTKSILCEPVHDGLGYEMFLDYKYMQKITLLREE